MADLSSYIVNPGPKTPVTGLKAAVTTGSAIVTETIIKVLNSGGNAVDAVIAGAMDGKPVFSAGSPGNIHCTLPQVLAYLLDFKLDPYAAVDAPRMLPMTDGQLVAIEDRLASGVVQDLHKLGVRVGGLSGYDLHMGSFSVIARDEASDTLTAVADPRRCAVADGIKE